MSMTRYATIDEAGKIPAAEIPGVTPSASPVPIAEGGTSAITAEMARFSLNAQGILATVTGINGLIAASTNLYTVPTGKSAVILDAVVRLTAATAITGTCRAGIGTNGAQSNIFMDVMMTGFNTTGEFYRFVGQGNYRLAAVGEIIAFGIDTAFGGTTATLAVDLIGYLV